jgi:2-keto-4-pentenoate hydratase/2-oxohepta-3-ene-1,7-dioic acid hydratase in catechol pathway
MKFCRVEIEGRPRWGQVEDSSVHLLDGSPLEDGAATGKRISLAAARLLPPVIPSVFYAVGLNYKDHIEHIGASAPARPEVGYRANNALIGHGAEIVKPAGVEGRFEAEGEVVAVIGRTLRRATYGEAEAAVFGWTIGNDVSARVWQHEDRSFWRSKNSDTFKPMGPWIETGVDPFVQTTTVRVDGEVRASFSTGAMVFDPFQYIVETTKYITMHPGDVLWMGADATCQIEPGNVVEIEISGIGTLSNPVRAERVPHERQRR